MALFNISGSGDWEVPEVGQKLCQNFDQDNIGRKKPKIKKKNKAKNIGEVSNVKATNIEVLHNKVHKSNKIVNGKNRLLGKIKKKLKPEKHSKKEDEIPFMNDNSSVETDYVNKKGLKRKNSSMHNDNKLLSKKHKKEMNANEQPKLITDFNVQTSKKKVYIASKHESKVDCKVDKKRKKKKNMLGETMKPDYSDDGKKIDPLQLKKGKRQLQKLQQLLLEKDEKHSHDKKGEQTLTLRQKMMRKLKAARFRFLNEQIYSTTSKETEKIFRHDPEAFKAYHEGYNLQVKRWPLNPLDKIINSLRKMNKSYIIADFGCGEARLAKSVGQKVHSFDLVAVNETVTACDMAHVPLQDSSVDVAIFCLSLMGTNLKDYILEANRVLKQGGVLKIAEVESRFEDINTFIKDCEKFGFKKTWVDLSHNLFYFVDFRKEVTVKDKKKTPTIVLQPCLYKKRRITVGQNKGIIND